MGNLVKASMSEIFATLELLEKFGVQESDLKRLRKEAQQHRAHNVMDVARQLRYYTPGALLSKGVSIDEENPMVPAGWKVIQHNGGSKRVWTDRSFGLLRPKSRGGNAQREEFKNEPVLNACHLDWLLANPYCIPNFSHQSTYLFWGTIYQDEEGDLVVRSLSRYGIGWGWHGSYFRYANQFDEGRLAVVRKE